MTAFPEDDFPGGQVVDDAQPPLAAGDQASRSQTTGGTQRHAAAADQLPGDHASTGAHRTCAAGGGDDLHGGHTSSGAQTSSAAVEVLSPWPEDSTRDLAAAADTLHDIERLRIASENRLRQFTRGTDEEDKDGGKRGFGWDLRSPAVASLATLVGGMKCDSEVVRQALGDDKPPKKKGCCLEHDAERNLTRALRANPLGPWVRAQKGIGEKQGGRLVATIGDPYMRPAMLREDETWEPARPRTVSELWAYCGLKPGQRRKRGELANWSATAKMRAWNVAGSMLKAGNREVYDKRKAATEGRLHSAECVRCGPSGKPALPGSAWSDGHRHADALRVVSKEILKELWREARRIHLETPVSGHVSLDAQRVDAAGGA